MCSSFASPSSIKEDRGSDKKPYPLVEKLFFVLAAIPLYLLHIIAKFPISIGLAANMKLE
jgi:hypothetical protein